MAGSNIPGTAGKRARRRRTQAIAKRYTFHASAIISMSHGNIINQ